METLKRNVRKFIKSDNDTARKISLALQKSPECPVRETIQIIIKYHLTSARYHKTTLMILEAIEMNIDHTSIVAKRKEIMSEIMQQMESLVAAGAMTENTYLDKCKEFKNDVEMLEEE